MNERAHSSLLCVARGKPGGNSNTLEMYFSAAGPARVVNAPREWLHLGRPPRDGRGSGGRPGAPERLTTLLAATVLPQRLFGKHRLQSHQNGRHFGDQGA